jgi:hypothetical protein
MQRDEGVYFNVSQGAHVKGASVSLQSSSSLNYLFFLKVCCKLGIKGVDGERGREGAYVLKYGGGES